MRRLTLRVLAILSALQLLAGAGLYLRGFPYFGTSLVANAALWEAPVALFHAPGVMALYLTGQCCGLRNGRVLGPRITGGHIRLSADGLALLSLTNWALWCVLGSAGTVAWLRRRRRAAAAPTEG